MTKAPTPSPAPAPPSHGLDAPLSPLDPGANGGAAVGDSATLERDVVAKVTRAPLQFAGVFAFNVPPDILFPHLTEPKKIAAWFPLFTGGSFDHSHSDVPDDWGQGTKRTCTTAGMGTLYETIHYWDAPRCAAYSVRNIMMPIKDHLALMVLEPQGPSSTRFEWRQYFHYKGLVMRHAFPTMMLTMMNSGMKTLAKRLGGAGGRMRKV